MAPEKMDMDVEDQTTEQDVFFSDSEPEQRNKKNGAKSKFEKDSDEEELERAVLGNSAGFRQNLVKNRDAEDLGLFEGLHLQDSSASALEHVRSEDLFAFDIDRPARGERNLTASGNAAADLTASGEVPAWVDSDDERLTISLAGVKQLRKLRETEADDLVNGVEYTRRLRLQYLRLNPLPKWARGKTTRDRREKRRRRSSAGATTASSSDEGDSDDDTELSDVDALPLEKLLRDISLLNGDGPRKKRKLRPEVVDIQRTRGIPDTHKSAVSSLSFHPQHPVLLSSSKSSILYLHHISPTAHPTPNPQLTSVQVKNVPIRRSDFVSPDGESVIFAGRRKFYHSWNLSSGAVQKITDIQGHHLEQKSMERFRLSPEGEHMAIASTSHKGGGMLNIVRLESMQWMAQARLDGRGGIADFRWWRDGKGLTILGKDGQVAEWSLTMRRTVGLWRDEGSIGGTVLVLGGKDGPGGVGGDKWVAIGSNSGVLNIYDRSAIVTKSPGKDGEIEIQPLPEPTRRCEQLTTAITVVDITPDGQLLAFGSQHKKDALRLVHLPSCTVYRNWPTDSTPLGRITAVAFSSDSTMLAVGNDVGKMRLWEIRA